MKYINLGNTGLMVPAVIVGCWRFEKFSEEQMNHYIHTALEMEANYFDHADIYGYGEIEQIFGKAIKRDKTIKREDLFIQSKVGIKRGVCYDLSKNHIIKSVDNILLRLQTDYIDVLLLHRPDALVEPEEVAEAFNELEIKGKVRYFGVSNHKPMQIELLKKYVKQKLIINQLQLSLAASNMITNGMEVNMETDGAIDRDGSVLDYSRLNNITIQAWSPFQIAGKKGVFLGNNQYEKLNVEINKLAEKYNTSDIAIAGSFILRHPANMQIVAGTTKEERLKHVIDAGAINLTREEWYGLYKTVHLLP